jgi:hypothetical protein
MRYTLRDLGYPYKSICQGRKQVGRVFKHADGHYVGMIGHDQAIGADDVEAFRNVASKALGFSSPEAVKRHNSNIRAQNKARRMRDNAELANLLGPELMNLMRSLRR